MKTSLVFIALAALSSGYAQTPAGSQAPATAAPAGATSKVAVINIQTAILSTTDGKKAAAELSAKFDPRKTTLQKRGEALQAKVEAARKGSATMSEDARAKMMRENDAENKALQRDSEDLNADIDQEQQRLMNDLGGKMMDVVTQYATANGYSMVLNVSDMSTPVLWHNPSTDITTEIIKLYDIAHPPSAAAAPAPAKKQ